MEATLLNQRYRLDQELGRGSMGTVYQGYDLLLERDVLVKVLNPANLDADGRERLLREARAVAKLDHPNIVPVYDAGDADGKPFVVMQAFVGQSLHEVGTLPIPQVIEIAIEVCRALDHAHSLGIIHRDVKPENVILVKHGEHWIARLTDFGLARSIASRQTVEGMIIGTVYYMAPEQALGQKADGRADLYALGVMLYELTTGKMPFDGSDALTILSQHLNAPVVPPSTHNGQVSSILEALILQLMRKRPEDRPASAEEVRQALERLTQPLADGKPRHNLPVQLTSFIGRGKESADIVRLLRQTRLLTLSGVGGTGKTRLSLHVAAEVMDEFEQGIWLVELARLTDPALILPTVAAVFGFYGDKPEMPLVTRLHHHLHDKRLLLILDNCEHLIVDAAQFVDNLLHAAPDVKVLATSREALGLEGERIYLVPALTLPDATQSPPLEVLHQCDAVRLFVERAQASQPAFSLTETNALDVAQICQRLDGIPLAIELAAARVKAISTDQICARLDNRFRLLTGGSRTALPRQQTLRATIDWSYALLSPAEQKLLRSLSVFVGGWTLEAAEAVCSCDELDVLDGLALLVNKSLVEAELEGGEVRRYRLLETVRQYAQEKLDETGEVVHIRNRHLEYFLAVSTKVERCMRTITGWDLMQSLRVESVNFRSALGWAYGASEPASIFAGLQLASNLYYYYETLNFLNEGVTWIKKGLALLSDNEEQYIPLRAKAYSCAADLSNLMDNNYDWFEFARESVRLYRKCKDADPVYMGPALLFCAHGMYHLEPKRPIEVNEAEAVALCQEATALVEQSGEPWGVVMVAEYNAYFALDRQNYPDVLNHNEKLRVACQGTYFEGLESYFLAQVAAGQGDYARGLNLYQKALELGRSLNLKVLIGWTLFMMGECAMELSQVELAWEYYHESMTIAREIGKKFQFTGSLRRLAEMCLTKGQYQQAGEYLLQGLTLATEMDSNILAFQCLFPLLIAAEEMALPEKMARLLGYIDQVIEDFNIRYTTRPRYEHISASLQACLGPEAFEANKLAGRKLTIEQVQTEARIVAHELASYQPPQETQ